MTHGGLGPGLTPESDGTSELELSVGAGQIDMQFGSGADQVDLGVQGRRRLISIGPGTADPDP